METRIQFQKDATVLAADGQELGALARVVLSPESRLVTHIVVRTGRLLNRSEKVIPIDLVARTEEDTIRLLDAAGELEAFPPFEEERLVGQKAGHDLPPVAGSNSPELIGYPEPNIPVMPSPGEEYVTQVEQNIPEGAVALKEGAKVISADGRDVGRLERVLAEPEGDKVTHLLISRGIFPRETRVIPMDWVTTLTDDKVHLRVEEHWVAELAEVSIAR